MYIPLGMILLQFVDVSRTGDPFKALFVIFVGNLSRFILLWYIHAETYATCSFQNQTFQVNILPAGDPGPFYQLFIRLSWRWPEITKRLQAEIYLMQLWVCFDYIGRWTGFYIPRLVPYRMLNANNLVSDIAWVYPGRQIPLWYDVCLYIYVLLYMWPALFHLIFNCGSILSSILVFRKQFPNCYTSLISE